MSSIFLMADGSEVNLDTSEFNIDIELIAHHLAKIQRYNGATPIDKSYSVAEHCLNLANHFISSTEVAEMFSQEFVYLLAMYSLIHDASEAYLGDVNSILKRLIPDYIKIEHQFERKLDHELFLKYLDDPQYSFPTIKTIVKDRDKNIILDETLKIMPYMYYEYTQLSPHLNEIGCRIYYNGDSEYVKNQYIRLYKDLKKELGWTM